MMLGPRKLGAVAPCLLVAACSAVTTMPPDETAPAQPTPDDSLVSTCMVAVESTCGGAVEGPVWDMVTSCREDDAAAFANPFAHLADCRTPDNTVEGNLVRSGTLQLQGGQAYTESRTHVDVAYRFADRCLEAVNPASSPARTCEAILGSGGLACSYLLGACDCSATIDEASDTTSPYEISQAEIRWGGDEPARSTFCVQGDRLVLDYIEHPVSPRWSILQRRTPASP